MAVISFVNVAGTFEENGDRNYKFISSPLNWEQVVHEFNLSKDYDFNVIEMWVDDNLVCVIFDFDKANPD